MGVVARLVAGWLAVAASGGMVRAQEASAAPDSSPRPADQQRIVPTEIFNQRGILTPLHEIILEPSFQYVQSSVQRVAIEGYTVLPAVSIGLIDIREVSRVTFVANLAARFGLTPRFEIEGRLPFVARSDQTVTRPLATPSTRDEVFDVHGADLGDTELALRWQMNQARPYFIGNLRLRIPTGTDPFRIERDEATGLPTELPTGSGFWALQPSITWVQISDPAVLFGNLSYYWTFPREVGGTYGTIDPGDVIGISIGSGFSLNEQVSLSIGFEHNTVLKTEQNGAEIPNVRNLAVGSLLLGYTYKSGNRTVTVSLAAGVTSDAPDVQLTVRVPVTFGGGASRARKQKGGEDLTAAVGK